MVLADTYLAEDLEDIGLYFQGLLQIMAADNHLHDHEKSIIRKFAEKAGFEDRYIENSIESALENRHLPRIPPRFHSRITAEDFLLKSAHIAICDGQLHESERQWLLRAAQRNGIDPGCIEPILNSVS